MKNIRKFLAIILSITMVMCSTLPSVASEIEVIDETTKSKIEEQLREDLGEERANEILNVGAKLGEPEEDEETTVAEEETTVVEEEETVGGEQSTGLFSVYGALPEDEENQIEAQADEEVEETTLAESEEETEETTAGSASVRPYDEEVEEPTATPSELSEIDEEETGTEETTMAEPVELKISIASKSTTDKTLYGADEPWMYWRLEDNETGKTIIFSSTDEGKTGTTGIVGNAVIDYGSLDKTTVTKAVFEDEIVAETCEDLFHDFVNLSDISNIANLKTGKVQSMRSMFESCVKISNLDLSYFDTSKVMTMKQLFFNCHSLASLNLTDFETLQVEDMSNMFSYCVALTSLDLSSFKTENVENMKYMFNYCQKLEQLDLKNFDTSNVISMEGMFQNCSELLSLDISSFNTEEVGVMERFLNNCSKLVSIDLSSFATPVVTSMKYMFSNCSSLEKIIVSNKFVAKAGIDAVGMFDGCTSLVGSAGTTYDGGHTNIEYARADRPDLGKPGYFTLNWMYWYLTDGEVIHFSSTNPGGATGINCGPNDEIEYVGLEKDDIREAKFDNVINAVTCQGFFDGFTRLHTIYGIANLKTNNVKYMTNMFYNCQGLTTLSLHGLDTSNVEYMTNMFGNCQSLNGLEMDTFDTSKVKTMNKMFENCEALNGLDLSKFDTSSVTTMASMFKNCKTLDNLILSSNFTTAEVTDMESMFESSEDLNNPDLSSFNTSKVTNMKSMFKDCTGLVKLDLTGFNTSNVYYMKEFLSGCSNIKTIDLSNFDTENVREMEKMFYNCSSLKTIIASDKFSTINVSDDGADMFSRCNGLIGCYGTWYETYVVRNKGYARIDSSSNNGYFSSAPWMYWYLTDSNQTIHYTSSKPTSGDYEIMTRRDTIVYHGLDVTEKRAITKAEFDNNITAVTCKTYFGDFRSLNDIVGLNKLNTQNVNGMDSMFADCSQLNSLDLSNFRTSNVTSMGYMFYNCSSLTSLDLNKFDTSNVENTQYMFQRCSSLTKIIVSNSIVTTSVTIHDNMFTNCTNLVGGAGTRYDGGHTDKEYARIDGGPTSATPGYFTLYVPPTPPAPTPTYPQNYTSDRDGGGGGGSIAGPLVDVIIPVVTYLPIVKNILATLNNTTSKWTKDTITNKHKLNIINQNGTETPATLGFYNYTNVVTHIINNLPVQTQTNDTYVFDDKGNMITGWVRTADGKWYLFEYEKTTNEGKMVIGWKKVQGAWYYFGTDGAMLTNAYTPDGHYVGPDGKWVG